MSERTGIASGEYVWSRLLPIPGQLVEIRRRQWIVGDVQGSAFASDGNGREHLVTLASLDEDSLGETLQVLWELEPGARVLERAGLSEKSRDGGHIAAGNNDRVSTL